MPGGRWVGWMTRAWRNGTGGLLNRRLDLVHSIRPRRHLKQNQVGDVFEHYPGIAVGAQDTGFALFIRGCQR